MKSEQGGFAWSQRPPVKRFVPIMSAKVGHPLRVIAAGPPKGVLCHYLDGRSSPCLARDASPCPACQSQKPRWKAYLPATLWTGARRIVEMTEACWRSLEALEAEGWEGQYLIFTRRGPNPNSPLLAERDHSRSPNLAILPFDVEPSVLNMWGLDGGGVPNGVHVGEG